ncbi:MAG TPA: leucyl/phenylalanyl-tRNA--protein transferase [Gammaproteobacteria bacterium]|nr:leucyl/phenylalanyl-tRNA--protein transferase [Gammaproteobacteria bacterium]
MTRGQSTYNKLYWVRDNIIANDFPDISAILSEPDGLLAIGGDLSSERLLDAYQRGIFPWYSEGQPILWWSPDPRWVLQPEKLKISRSLKKTMRKRPFRVTFDRAFDEVIKCCAEPRKDSIETWITREIIESYYELHRQGYAHSVECWQDDNLAGGLYGIALGRVFFGESMFSYKTDASKIALVHLCRILRKRQFVMIDCQVHSEHVERLGAEPLAQSRFADILRQDCYIDTGEAWPAESDFYE